MLTVMAKRKIQKVLLNEMQERLESFGNDVLNLCKGSFLPNANLDEDKKAEIARKRYLNGVAYKTFSRIRKISKSPELIQLVVNDPSECGYDFDLNNGITAGAAYAIAFFILTHKVADSVECSKLTHYQVHLMDCMLAKIEHELT